jgi:phosphate acyltransferase
VRVAVDAAGLEPGHRVVVEGVLKALDGTVASKIPLNPVIYGPAEILRNEIEELGGSVDSIEIVDSPEVVEMHESPREALLTKPNSSIVRAVRDLAAGVVDAFVSMGNTGAVVGASRAYLGKIRWINRPALGTPLPRKNGMGFMLDVGATPDPKSGHMLQFAAMGAAFVERVYGIENPKVGLMNIGTESNKGDERSKDVYKLLSRSPLNFIGNIEGSDLFGEKADVIVSSGFVGNVLLKFSETIPSMIDQFITGNDLSGNGRLKKFDYSSYGGATLLGVNGNVVIGHGRSSSSAVARAIEWSCKIVSGNLENALREKVFKTRRAVLLTNPFVIGDGSDDI